MDDLNSLTPADYNPRVISKADYAALKNSIGTFGDMSGLVFNRQTGSIVGGHQRANAYKEGGGVIEITEALDAPNEVGTVARGYVTIGTDKPVVGYDLTPAGIIKKLKLREPIFADTARYGHFGNAYLWDLKEV